MILSTPVIYHYKVRVVSVLPHLPSLTILPTPPNPHHKVSLGFAYPPSPILAALGDILSVVGKAATRWA